MPARTFTSAGVNNLWSNPANWDGGATIPQEDDSVTIPAGQTCEYDYNSAYTTGIAGITITGTLKLTRAPGTYRLYMKASSTIAGAGTFDCGTLASPIPFAAKHTITGGNAFYIDGNAQLTLTAYGTEPTIKYVQTTGAEAIGQTELGVGTSVVGDLWADGDAIMVSDVNKASREVEQRVIAAGGIAAGAITVTAGLTAAKDATSYVILLTRNLKFISGANYSLFNRFKSGKLTLGSGEFRVTTTGYVLIANSPGTTISGGVYCGVDGVANPSLLATESWGSVITGGVFCGLQNVIGVSSASTISGGLFAGCTNGIAMSGSSISGGIFAGCLYAVNGASGISITGGTFYRNYDGILNSSGIISNAQFIENAIDVDFAFISATNTLFNGTSEFTNYSRYTDYGYSESVDHDQVAGAYRAWTAGGITTKQAVTYPVGYDSAMQTALESATKKGYWQKEIVIGAGASVNIAMNLRKDASMAYLPRVIVFNKASADPFAGGAGLHTFTMTNSIDTWEDDLYTYTNTTSEDVTLVIRCQGMNATGNMYSALLVEQINVDLTSAIALVTAVKAKTDQLVFTVANQVDANALTGGGGATAADVRIEMDANSTQLSGIKAKTDNLPTDPADQSLLAGLIGGLPSSADVITALKAAVFDGTLTFEDSVKLYNAILIGKLDGGGTGTLKFRDPADTKDRITATVDLSNGDRDSITLDLS